ncbi:MAG: pantoate--beta-alanine ligase [Thermodesulfobacteriota bacterium]|nr:pantoate--beta-alanine ligase [Thermodesulfobacteriota bacterium]
MELIETVENMRAWSVKKQVEGRRIGFVPTMGYLHAGHLSLMEYARKECDLVVVSVFVNPLQFGPKEDLAEYPRDLERDMDLMRPVPVDAVFHPEPKDMYPPGFQTRVEVTEVTKGWCGAFRPGHFVGVTTVVLKLFNIVRPHVAVFGNKDFQQVAVIKRMAEDLGLDLIVEGRPTVREPDGLAMSSRNTYLSPKERRKALSLSQALKTAQDMAAGGERDAGKILAAVRGRIEAESGVKIQYAVLADPVTLRDVERLEGRAVLALAVFAGGIRLIDNAIIAES